MPETITLPTRTDVWIDTHPTLADLVERTAQTVDSLVDVQDDFERTAMEFEAYAAHPGADAVTSHTGVNATVEAAKARASQERLKTTIEGAVEQLHELILTAVAHGATVPALVVLTGYSEDLVRLALKRLAAVFAEECHDDWAQLIDSVLAEEEPA